MDLYQSVDVRCMMATRIINACDNYSCRKHERKHALILTINLQEALREHAELLGLELEDLTEFQMQQAVLNVVLEVSENRAEGVNDCGFICEYVEPYGFVPECGCPVHNPEN